MLVALERHGVEIISADQTLGAAVADLDVAHILRIAPGVPLTAENTTLAQIPGKTPPAHTYTNSADLDGRVASQQLVQGQPINERLLAPKGQGFGLQAMIPEGVGFATWLKAHGFTFDEPS